MAKTEKQLRDEIQNLVSEYYSVKFSKREFIPGKTPVRYAGRVFDDKEICSLVDSALDFWLTAGRFTEEFEAEFSQLLDVEYAFVVNSGSSANLVAFAALTSPLLGDKRLKPGDEVISVAAGFPTTVNPVIQHGMVPVFVDIDIGTYNVLVDQVEKAISPKTRAIFIAHTLGNPFNVDAILEIVCKHNLYFIEDCCDALGSKYKDRNVGTFGHMATFSFYPAHHITMGEGGAVVTSDETLARAIRSLRDWGRDCYCTSGENNTCGKRFNGQYGKLPKGYDHKYVYSHVGYNLKATDMQAAIGVEQLKKLSVFCQRRKENFNLWKEGFKQWERFFILPHPTEGSDPSWFAFPVTVRNDAGFTRTSLTNHLDTHLIETRNLFAGNITLQPAYVDCAFRRTDELTNTNIVMSNTFFLGTFPGITPEQVKYTINVIHRFIQSNDCIF
ncbi:MAG: lipopolysaccharide biosynthesis protein RfbH [Chitinivibrionales bacterium]|nr:lipopolysaccharide biosynthesis protein RfbH [Chitinivibrionales bacterium]